MELIVLSFAVALSKTSTNTSATFWASRHLRVQPACRTAAGVVFVLCRPVKNIVRARLPGVSPRPCRPPLPVALFYTYWLHLKERPRPGLELFVVLATARSKSTAHGTII